MGIKKKHNGVSSREFLIKLNTKNINDTQIKDIIAWLKEDLKKLVVDTNEEYVHMIYDSYELQDETIDIDMLIHFSKCNHLYNTDNDEIICINEYPSNNPIDPKKILNTLSTESEHIIKLGVSGISEQLMKDLWWVMIGEDDGYMTYRSDIISTDDIINVREQSFNFGWEDYATKRNYF